MNVYQVAQANQFGNLVEKHRANTVLYLILTPVSLLLGALTLLISVHGIPLWGGYRLYSIWILAVGLFFIIAGIYSLITAIATIGIRLFLFERGLIYKNFGSAKIVPYEAITAIWQGRLPINANDTSAATEQSYTIETNQGKKLKIADIFEKVGEIGERLQKEIVLRQLPEVLNDYHRGYELQFGPLVISRDGIGNVLGTLPWSEIEAVRIRNSVVIVEGKDGNLLNWSSVQIAQVPNLYLFLELVEEILTDKGA